MPVYNDNTDAMNRLLQGLTVHLVAETPHRIAEYTRDGARSADGTRFSYPAPAMTPTTTEISDAFGR